MAKVKVRIAVCVDRNGKYNACGWGEGDEHDMMMFAAEHLELGEARYWLTAELDIPEGEVPAEVEKA